MNASAPSPRPPQRITWSGVARLLLTVGLAADCRHPGSARLEGRWRGVRAEGVTSDAMPAANAFAAATEISVNGDMLLITAPGSREYGRFRVISEDARTVVIGTEGNSLDQRETFTFEDAHTMKWVVAEGESILFSRE